MSCGEIKARPGYKLTGVGEIPEDWDVKPLNSVLIKGRLGGNYANQYEESNYPLMKMGNIARNYFDVSKVEFIASSITSEEQHQLIYGDILFNTRNTLDLVGKVAIWRDELSIAYFNSNIMRMEFDKYVICSNEYANYALNTKNSIICLRSLATGTTSVAAIYTRDLLGFEFVVPPKKEQTAIAAALSDADALIGALEQSIAKKRNIKQGAMQELLAGKRRLPGFTGEWEEVELGSILTISHGKSQKIVEDVNGKYPILASGGRIGSANQYIYDKPSIVIGRKGTIDKPQYMDEPFWTVDTLFYSNVHNKNIPKFLFYKFCLVDWNKYNEASGVPSLNATTIERILVTIPPLDEKKEPTEQAAIAAVLTDMDNAIAAQEAKLAKARLIKAGMMQELLTGRIRLICSAGMTPRTQKLQHQGKTRLVS